MLYRTETSLDGNDTLPVLHGKRRPTRRLTIVDVMVLLFAFVGVVIAFTLLAAGSVVAWAVRRRSERPAERRSVARFILSEDRLVTTLSAAGFSLGAGGLVWIMFVIRSNLLERLWA